MKKYNILILSVGRRVELVNCFKNAARSLKIDSTIIGADYSKTAPALYFSDIAYQLPKISSLDYIENIIKCCNENDISVIVPTIDTELLPLSKNKNIIESSTNAKLLISDYSKIEICRDKTKTQRFLESNGFKAPHMYTEEELNNTRIEFPLFIKPKDGSSSINAKAVYSYDELRTNMKSIKNYIVQDFIEGTEFTIDAFLDFESRIITIVPRQRIATRSGEILKGRIVKDRMIIEEVRKLLEILKPIGHITIQCMKTDRGIEFIEINPRFGGGAPMSIKAGADSCKNLYRILMNQKLNYNEDYKENLLFLRFDSCICLNERMELMRESIEINTSDMNL